MNSVAGSRVHTEWQNRPSCCSTLQVRVKERHCCSLWLRSLTAWKLHCIGNTVFSSTNYSGWSCNKMHLLCLHYIADSFLILKSGNLAVYLSKGAELAHKAPFCHILCSFNSISYELANPPQNLSLEEAHSWVCQQDFCC